MAGIIIGRIRVDMEALLQNNKVVKFYAGSFYLFKYFCIGFVI